MQATDWKILNQQIVARAMADPAYRQLLLSDPRGAVAKAFGQSLPANLKVQVIEQEPDTVYLFLPLAGSDEMSEAELDAVAGGGSKPLIFTSPISGESDPLIFTGPGSIQSGG
jgi:hypothetical protein